MVGLADEIPAGALGRFHITFQRVAQIGIEVGQAGTVYNQVERPAQPLAQFCFSSPNPGWLTSPSTTSIFSVRKRAKPEPYCCSSRSKTGESSTIFSKRLP